jgi:hypothetical protein
MARVNKDMIIMVKFTIIKAICSVLFLKFNKIAGTPLVLSQKSLLVSPRSVFRYADLKLKTKHQFTVDMTPLV